MRKRKQHNLEAPSLFLVPQADADEVWILAEPYIKAGCEQGEAVPEELLRAVLDGDAHLWIAFSDHCEAAAVTKIMRAPHGLVCLLDAFGAESLERVRHLTPKVGEWAKKQGCVALRIYGRLGWQRVMKDFTPRWVAMDKKL
jgi:hypothetical protein